MVSASFVQTSFLGGQWSDMAQGRMDDPEYKKAMNVCVNGYPLEAGAWTRRQGFRYLAHTKGGKPGLLRAFDFSVTQPYQLEFTDGFVRFFAGLDLVTFSEGILPISTISTDNPAVVTLGVAIPPGWSNGATILFNIQTKPCASTILCNRQFVVQSIDTDAKTFTLFDAITNQSIDGSAVAYTKDDATLGSDFVSRVFELATPYNAGSWSTLRSVQDTVSVLLLHTAVQPRAITAQLDPISADGAPFQINTQDFQDGPYLDINETSTTLTPSGTTGSITLTASATVGINDGAGFQASDVGRLVRFQCAPALWLIGTTYAKGAIVLGSDENIYVAQLKTTGNDPTTDDGTNWQLNNTTVIWTWLTITAVSSTLIATATVMDAAAGVINPNVPSRSLTSTTATTQWRLGAFGGPNGYPTNGVYHEGRLWLAGALGNRFDASYSDDHFNFSPTLEDGTVTDANGISETLNAKEVNQIFWMLSTGDGVMMGTQSVEWRIRASVLNDPITPSSIQAAVVSKYGCSNVEPVEASLPVFVQRQQRRLLAHMPVTDAKYLGGNLNRNADDITESGIAEIRWQQEPNLTIWARRNDGALVGSVFQRVQNYAQFGGKEDSFTGWHEHFLGTSRIVESISTGPAFDGLSDALYMVTNKTNTDDPDYGVRWVECLSPLFDSTQPDWASLLTDAAVSPCCARQMISADGDPFDGVRLYGFWHLNGLTVAPTLGGLDLGDRAVSNGSCDIPYLTDPEKGFTETFLQSFTGEYGLFGVEFVREVASTIVANSIGTYCNAIETHGNFSFADVDQDTVYGMNSTDEFFDVFDYNTFALLSSTPFSTLFEAGVTFQSGAFCATGGFVYQTCSHGLAKIKPEAPFPTIYMDAPSGVRSLVPIPGTTCVGLTVVTSVSQVQFVGILDVAANSFLTYTGGDVTEDVALICPGEAGGLNLFALGVLNNFTTGDTFGVYKVADVFGTGAAFSEAGKVAPTDIDATWTKFSAVHAPVNCSTDNTIIFGVETSDAVTNKAYLVKYDPFAEAIIWKSVLPSGDTPQPGVTQAKTPVSGHYAWYANETGLYYVQPVDGSFTTKPFQSIYLAQGASYFDEGQGSCTVFGNEASWAAEPTLLGAYSQANETVSVSSGRTSKLFFGIPIVEKFTAPAVVGMNYISQGQLLRPDYGADAGPRNGPAFGKKRRLHWWSAAFVRARNVLVGTIFNLRVLKPVSFASDGGKPNVAPALYSGTRTNTINDDENFDSMIAWQCSRPYPCVITAVGGYIESVDK